MLGTLLAAAWYAACDSAGIMFSGNATSAFAPKSGSVFRDDLTTFSIIWRLTLAYCAGGVGVCIVRPSSYKSLFINWSIWPLVVADLLLVDHPRWRVRRLLPAWMRSHGTEFWTLGDIIDFWWTEGFRIAIIPADWVDPPDHPADWPLYPASAREPCGPTLG